MTPEQIAAALNTVQRYEMEDVSPRWSAQRVDALVARRDGDWMKAEEVAKALGLFTNCAEPFRTEKDTP